MKKFRVFIPKDMDTEVIRDILITLETFYDFRRVDVGDAVLVDGDDNIKGSGMYVVFYKGFLFEYLFFKHRMKNLLLIKSGWKEKK